MYSVDIPHPKTKFAHTSMSLLATQIISEHLVHEAEKTTDPSSGLHASQQKGTNQPLQWVDIGQATVSRVTGILQTHQLVTWHYLLQIATKHGHEAASASLKYSPENIHFGCHNLLEHFTALAASRQLPGFDILHSAAIHLHQTYSTTCSIYFTLSDVRKVNCWTESVPLGTPWNKSSIGSGSSGDRVLANSMILMCDLLVLKELSYAIVEGDLGHVYEVMKFLLFIFSGFSHSKYCSYLLKTIMHLELKSSDKLHDAILKSTLVNLPGREGSFSAADIMQEYFNCLLESIVEKKGVEYSDTFIHHVVLCNLHHFAHIKLDLQIGVGMDMQSGKYSTLSLAPETKILLQLYQDHELHYQCPGQAFNTQDRDMFRQGLEKLNNSCLEKWIIEMTTTCDLCRKAQIDPTSVHIDDPSDSESDTNENEDNFWAEDDITGFSLPMVIDGDLCLVTFSMPPEQEINQVFTNVNAQYSDIQTGGSPEIDPPFDPCMFLHNKLLSTFTDDLNINSSFFLNSLTSVKEP
ncbi:hypothetical protein AN958_07988 [Leucoagaricus sp. SymC.cos]|nr:hypothetical protein AN958_07988 [Leucoagaricus sp. SymC.cos]